MSGSDANGQLALLYLDASASIPTEHPLNAGWVEQLVRSRLGNQKNKAFSIRVGRTEWLAGGQCLLHLHLGSDPSAVVLSLDTDSTKPTLKELASK